MKIGLIGYGNLGFQVEHLLRERHQSEEIRFFKFDDKEVKKSSTDVFPFEAYLDSKYSDLDFYVCLGYLHLPLKNKVLMNLKESGRKIGTFIHHTCYVNPAAKISPGSILYPMCNVDYQVHLGYGTLLNNSVVVSHETQIGDCTYISPGAVISGLVKIGKFSFVGSGATIANGVKVGDNVKVGIGSAITKDVQSGASVIGNPFRVLSRDLRLS